MSALSWFADDDEDVVQLLRPAADELDDDVVTAGSAAGVGREAGRAAATAAATAAAIAAAGRGYAVDVRHMDDVREVDADDPVGRDRQVGPKVDGAAMALAAAQSRSPGSRR